MLIDGLPLEAPAAPLADLLRVGLKANPEAPALVAAHRSMSWRELETEAERLAGGYRGMGLEPGERIASLMPNRIALIVHYLACFNPLGSVDSVPQRQRRCGTENSLWTGNYTTTSALYVVDS